METNSSRSQIIKVTLLSAILLIAVVFKRPIKEKITSFQKSSSSSKYTRKKSTSYLSKESVLIIEKLSDLPLVKGKKATLEEWPENLERNIFDFKKIKAAKRKRTRSRPKLKLEATFPGDPPMAVINNQPLLIDQTISGYQLLEIDEAKVILIKNGRQVTLTLK